MNMDGNSIPYDANNFEVNFPFNSTIVVTTAIPKRLKLDKEQYKELWSTHPPTRFVGGPSTKKSVERYMAGSGKSYKHEGGLPEIKHPLIDATFDYIHQFTNQKYNGVIVNYYVNGADFISAHSDDPNDLVDDSFIFGFSYGCPRTLRITLHTVNHPEALVPKAYDILLPNNSMYIMSAEMQRHWKHEIVKDVAGNRNKSRISKTYRNFK